MKLNLLTWYTHATAIRAAMNATYAHRLRRADDATGKHGITPRILAFLHAMLDMDAAQAAPKSVA
jgi:hypothetical protein